MVTQLKTLRLAAQLLAILVFLLAVIGFGYFETTSHLWPLCNPERLLVDKFCTKLQRILLSQKGTLLPLLNGLETHRTGNFFKTLYTL